MGLPSAIALPFQGRERRADRPGGTRILRKQTTGPNRATTGLLVGLCALVALPTITSAQPSRAWSPLAQDIRLAGDQVREWREGSVRYILLEGHAYIERGLERIRAERAIAWIDEETSPDPIHALFLLAEGSVRAEGAGRTDDAMKELYERWETKAEIRVPPGTRQEAPAQTLPIVFRARQLHAKNLMPAGTPRGEATPADGGALQPIAARDETTGEVHTAELVPSAAGDASVRPAQALGPFSPDPNPTIPGENRPTPRIRDQQGGMMPSMGASLGSAGPKRIRWFPRSSQPFSVSSSLTPDGQFRQWLFTGGVNLIVEDPLTNNTVDIVADRAVLWTRGELGGDSTGGGLQTDGSQQVEVYLEGNVYIRQGNPSKPTDVMSVVMFGKQVYFNVNTNQAMVVDGAVEATEPRLGVPLYMTAPEIRQLAPGEYFGRNAAFTTSIHRGTPGYAIQGSEIYFEEIKERLKNPFTGQEVIDTDTGQPIDLSRHFVTGYGNVLRVNDFPVFFWPYVRANAEDPLGPVEDIRVGQSQNLGTIASVTLDVWQLIGLDYLPIANNTNWLLDVGYFSDRGISAGTRGNYFGHGLLTENDRYWGNLLGWYINDNGYDQLGPTRRGLVPSTNDRGRILYQNRYDIGDSTTIQTEVSYLSDSNVLESFFETEYDSGKDQDTILYAKHTRDNWAITGLVQPRLREFLPQNQWLPRGDFHWIGQPLFGDRATYYTHNSISYGSYNYPSNYPYPGEQDFDVARGDTRHEFDLPLSLGPWEVTPFVIGQVSGYTQTQDTDGLGRLYGAAGVRTTLPFYRIYPGVRSDLWYLNGIAHKVNLNADYFFARSNRNYDELPLLDQLDDDTSDLVRRQNMLRTFGGLPPTWYDPRFQALRRNLFFYPEILDDQDNLRLSVTQRLQTKRGPATNLRIIDWMYLDSGFSIFPNANRDNLGETFGLIDYTYRWNVGDRTAIQSDGLYEPFGDLLQLGGGIFCQRPPRSTLSLLFSHFASGPFQSNFIGAATSYRFSSRYAGYFEIGKDLESPDAVNVRAAFSRVGLDFVTTLGINWNAGRDDFGVDFSILPRVGVRQTFGRSALQSLPFGVDPTLPGGGPAALERQAILNNNMF